MASKKVKKTSHPDMERALQDNEDQKPISKSMQFFSMGETTDFLTKPRGKKTLPFYGQTELVMALSKLTNKEQLRELANSCRQEDELNPVTPNDLNDEPAMPMCNEAVDPPLLQIYGKAWEKIAEAERNGKDMKNLYDDFLPPDYETKIATEEEESIGGAKPKSKGKKYASGKKKSGKAKKKAAKAKKFAKAPKTPSCCPTAEVTESAEKPPAPSSAVENAKPTDADLAGPSTSSEPKPTTDILMKIKIFNRNDFDNNMGLVEPNSAPTETDTGATGETNNIDNDNEEKPDTMNMPSTSLSYFDPDENKTTTEQSSYFHRWCEMTNCNECFMDNIHEFEMYNPYVYGGFDQPEPFDPFIPWGRTCFKKILYKGQVISTWEFEDDYDFSNARSF